MKKTNRMKLGALVLFMCICATIMMAGCSSETMGHWFSGGNIVINEVVTSNSASLLDDVYGSPDWIELYNKGTTDVNLENYALSNDLNSPAKYLFPNVTLKAGEYMVVYAAKQIEGAPEDKLCTGFKLSSKGTMLILTAAGGDTLQKLEIPALISDVSYGRDSKGQYKQISNPTPGVANAENYLENAQISEMPENAPLQITEILAKNTYSIIDSEGDRSGWVEVTNVSSQPVQLENYRLTDEQDNYGKWAFPQKTLEPGQQALVFCSGKGKVLENGEMHASFRISSGDASICLTDLTKMQQQVVQLPGAHKANISYGLKDGKWQFFAQPTPGASNTTKGFDTLAAVPKVDLTGLYINEVCSVQPPKSGQRDWVEIANGSGQTVDLTGYYLSDDVDNLKKYKIKGKVVGPGGYVVIEASSKAHKQSGGVATFGISGSGETLFLSSPQGGVLDSFETGVLRRGISSGRIQGDDSGQRAFFSTQTPGAPNAQPAGYSYTAKPTFSVGGGIQEGPIQVSISCADETAKIHYTTDGTRATSASPEYTGPIKISQNQVLSAVAVAPNKLTSEVMTATYLFNVEHTVPIVSVSMSPEDFTAMYGNTLTSVNIEKQCFVEYYEPEGVLGVSFPAGVRITGWSNRTASQKSLMFKLRGAYGLKEVTYPFFENSGITTYRALTVRNGGQDKALARIRDAFCSRVAAQGMNLDASNNKWVVVYINGRYWGLYDLREDLNASTLAAKHGVEEDTVNYYRRYTMLHGDENEIVRVAEYIKTHDMSDPKVYEQVCKWVDVEAFADYLVARNYFKDTDMFNQKSWATSDYKVKFRPIYFDMDYALSSGTETSTSMIGPYITGSMTTGHGTVVPLDYTAGLLKNSQFRQLLLDRFVYHINNTFQPDKLVALVDEMAAGMEPEMSKQIARFGQPSSVSAWKQEIESFKRQLRERPKYAKQLVKNYFGLSDEKMKELFPN